MGVKPGLETVPECRARLTKVCRGRKECGQEEARARERSGKTRRRVREPGTGQEFTEPKGGPGRQAQVTPQGTMALL